MDHFYKLGHESALTGLGLVKSARTPAVQASKRVLSRLQKMFGPAATSRARPSAGAASRATPPPIPSQWVPPGAAKPVSKPTAGTSIFNAPDAPAVNAAETAFGGVGQPGRASNLLGKAKRYAVPAGLLGAGGYAMSGGNAEEPGLPVQQPYYSEMGYY